MEPTWKEQGCHIFKNNNIQSVYSLILHDDEPELTLELKNPLQEKPEMVDSILSFFFPEPVRVIKNPEGVEELRYNSSVMEVGKIYKVEWSGRQYGIRKTSDDVEVLRFYPDES